MKNSEQCKNRILLTVINVHNNFKTNKLLHNLSLNGIWDEKICACTNNWFYTFQSGMWGPNMTWYEHLQEEKQLQDLIFAGHRQYNSLYNCCYML